MGRKRIVRINGTKVHDCVKNVLRERGPSTIDEIAKALGVQRDIARGSVGRLRRDGKIEVVKRKGSSWFGGVITSGSVAVYALKPENG